MEERENLSREELRARIKEETRKKDEDVKSPQYLNRERERKSFSRRDRLSRLALFLAFFAFAMFYAHNYTRTTYALDAEIRLGALSEAEVHSFSAGAVVVGGDTITFIEEGTVVWTSSVSLSDPVVSIRGDYFAVFDEGGYQVYICGREGIISNVRLSRKIRGMDISASGVTAVFTESGEAAYVSYFDRFGSRLDVEVKTVLGSSGYPLHIALSPDGQKLLMLLYSTASGIGESRLLLYDFENGREDAGYIVLNDSDFYNTDTLLLSGRFIDDTHFVLIGDNEAVFMEYVPKKGAEELSVIPLSENISSVFFAGTKFGAVETFGSGFLCRIYTDTGEEYAEFEAPSSYEHIRATEDFILFTDKADIFLYNISGRKRYEGSLVSEPVDLDFIGKGRLLINTGSLIEEINIK